MSFAVGAGFRVAAKRPPSRTAAVRFANVYTARPKSIVAHMISMRNGTTSANSTRAAPRSLFRLNFRRIIRLIDPPPDSYEFQEPREPGNKGKSERHRDAIRQCLATGWHGKGRREQLRVLGNMGDPKCREAYTVRQH